MTSAKVEQKRNTKIEKILDVSMGIILEQGMAALTMRNLAKNLEITPGALYRYFKSKGDIISLLGQRILTRYTDGFQRGEEFVLDTFPAMSPQVKSIVQILVIDKYYWLPAGRHAIARRYQSNLPQFRALTNPPDADSLADA